MIETSKAKKLCALLSVDMRSSNPFSLHSDIYVRTSYKLLPFLQSIIHTQQNIRTYNTYIMRARTQTLLTQKLYNFK